MERGRLEPRMLCSPFVKYSTLVVGVSGAGRLASRYAAMLEGSTRVVDLSSGLYWRALLRMRGIIGMSPDVHITTTMGSTVGKSDDGVCHLPA